METTKSAGNHYENISRFSCQIQTAIRLHSTASDKRVLVADRSY